MGPASLTATLPWFARSTTCVTPAVHENANLAMRNGSQKSLRKNPRYPTIPMARLAPATSVWKGLPAAQPIERAISSAHTV